MIDQRIEIIKNRCQGWRGLLSEVEKSGAYPGLYWDQHILNKLCVDAEKSTEGVGALVKRMREVEAEITAHVSRLGMPDLWHRHFDGRPDLPKG